MGGQWWNPYRSNSIPAVLLKWSVLCTILMIVMTNVCVWTGLGFDGWRDSPATYAASDDPLRVVGICLLICFVIWVVNVLLCSIALRGAKAVGAVLLGFLVVLQAILMERNHERAKEERHLNDQKRQAELTAKAIAQQAKVDAGRLSTPVS